MLVKSLPIIKHAHMKQQEFWCQKPMWHPPVKYNSLCWPQTSEHLHHEFAVSLCCATSCHSQMFHVQTPYLVSSPFGLPHSLVLHAADHTTLQLASTQTNNVKLHDCEA
jgi:hypothetical protein